MKLYFNLIRGHGVMTRQCRCARMALLGWTLLALCSTQGQEALKSALSTDAIIHSEDTPPTAPAPDEHYLRALLFSLSASLGTTFDDNANLVERHPKSDIILNGGIGLDLSWPATEKSELSLNSQFGYATYLAHTRNDTLDISPDSALTWSIQFEDGSVSLFDQFNYSEQVVTVASVGGVASLPRFDNTIGARGQWTPGAWLFELGLSHSDFRSTSTANEYLDSGSEYVFARGGRSFSEKTQVGLELSASETDYRASFQQDNISYSLGPYATWNLTEFLNASIRGGPTIYQFIRVGPLEPASTLTSYYLSFDLSHQLTQFISQHLSANREVNLGLNRGNAYNEQFSVNYDISWQTTDNLRFSAGGAYTLGSQPLTGPFGVSTEHYKQAGLSLGISYQFTIKSSANIAYSYWKRISNITGSSYDENSISLQMTYRF